MVEFGLTQPLSPVQRGRRRHAGEIAELPVDRPAYMHSLRHDRALSRSGRVSADRQRARPQVLGQAVHPQLSLAARARAQSSTSSTRTPAARSRPRAATRSSPSTTSTPIEQGGGLVIDMVAYPDATIIDQLYLARLRAGTPLTATGELTRFELGSWRRWRDHAPRRSRRFRSSCRASTMPHAPASRYRYVWGTGIAVEGDFLDQIVKIDLETGEVRALVRGRLLSGRAGVRSLTFGARPRMTACCCRSCSTRGKDRSFLLVLDAATLARDRPRRDAARHSLPLPRQLFRRRSVETRRNERDAEQRQQDGDGVGGGDQP